MTVQTEHNTMAGSKAEWATSKHRSCKDTWSLKSGTYGRDRTADFDLGCKVELVRVYVSNSNKKCEANTRCSLKKFDIHSKQPDNTWPVLGRHKMSDPGNSVGKF